MMPTRVWSTDPKQILAVLLLWLSCAVAGHTQRDLVLAVDLSGSMHAPAKREILRATNSALIDGLLEEGDWFAVIGFTKEAKEYARFDVGSQKDPIRARVLAMEPTRDGWTNIEAAKALAIRLLRERRGDAPSYTRAQYLLLVSDGEATHALTRDHPLYSLWQQHKGDLQKAVSFSKSGVTLSLFTYLTAPDQKTIDAIRPQGAAEIGRWVESLRERTRQLGGNIASDAVKHSADGLMIRPVNPVVRDGAYVLNADETGISQQLELVSNFEVGYATGKLRVGISRLESTLRGPIPGNQANVTISAQGASNSAFTLSPMPAASPEDAEQQVEQPYKQEFLLRIELPQPTFPWSASEHLKGTLEFSVVDGRLLAVVSEDSSQLGAQDARIDAEGVDLPPGLPLPQQMQFVAERPQRIANTIALVAGLAVTVLAVALTLYMLWRPCQISIGMLGAGQDKKYQLGVGRSLTIGGPPAAMSYPLEVPLAAAISRPLFGPPRVRAVNGRLFEGDLPAQSIVLRDRCELGLGSSESTAPEVRLEIHIISGDSAPASDGSLTGSDWPE